MSDRAYWQVVEDIAGEDFSGAVLIVRSGERIYSEAFGFANLEWQVPFAQDSVFRIASI